ncbi:hypothetical protein CLAFUW4_07290 [Fulvia fulva]|uniref:Uncharacterized protein n=1 Tax=Passalora fulva TaxID=5499 RepID=A0A9Q8PA32_PASFU|nr:uncharacterized protein CLAFUR5_07420 [Fulvia fulva]KAK4621398.1 hypothetical protein CLAFUR4_07298 [Fulvia fulva]KAK4623426.1 hypothetical protein CLAFUR0_07296 [Fulvia fulva]UJO18689.1 hypothetical protein CLAFUR5_07420 [Fulvia fulva]WPV16545.1 hypothetical protein CLAFUW4_07290 [Fulvia fulva]WPV31237.1 hypothetical protein CLAFUW7_07292 [Fulvia fulva]
MAQQPVLVRAYTDSRPSTALAPVPRTAARTQALPPISSFAFDDIFRSVDSPELQNAIQGIAEICAKNRMSLADEYASHLPPLGEITATNSRNMRSHVIRPSGGIRRALTSVPEGSSGSSEGSRKSKKKASLFSFGKQQPQESKPMRRIRIGSMGRMVPVGTTTAMAAHLDLSQQDHTRKSSQTTITPETAARPASRPRSLSAAQTSLQRLLGIERNVQNG